MPLESVGIYRSTDDGLTWTKTANGPGPNTAIYAEELLVHGSTVIATRFVNTGELFYSNDSGASWQLATGIPNNSGQPVGLERRRHGPRPRWLHLLLRRFCPKAPTNPPTAAKPGHPPTPASPAAAPTSG